MGRLPARSLLLAHRGVDFTVTQTSLLRPGHRVRPGYPVPFAVAAHVQLARYRRVFGWILREEAHPIGCYEVKPLQKRSILIGGQRPAQKSHASIEKLPRAHTRCRGGRPLDMGDWCGVCVPRWL